LIRTNILTRRAKAPCQTVLALLLLASGLVSAQEVTVTGRVEWSNRKKNRGASSVVVWLTPVQQRPETAHAAPPDSGHLRLVQRNKSFEPHIQVVPVNSMVEFPNRDPFFHNVFSLFEGKRFDLGLYEAGTTRYVRFDKPGISYIFCNIHPEMSAVVIALDTPYYAISSPSGDLTISGVPAGRYSLQLWYEASLPDTLIGLVHEIEISGTASSLGNIRLTEAKLPLTHKNKYGQDYEKPAPSSPVYEQP